MMKIFFAGAALLLGVAMSVPALAQATTTKAEITKLDKAGGRITLKHEEIKNLDMPPMTMVFRVSNPGMLDGLAVGNRIRFTAERINGQYTLTSVSKAP